MTRPRSHRRSRRLARAIALAMTGLLALGACSGGGDGGQGYVSGEATVTTYAVAHRHRAPAIAGKTLDGGRLALASYRGKVVVLNFWGSWCPPCRAESPFLQTMATDYAGRGVQFVGLDLRDDPDSARAFLTNFQSTYPNLVDDSENTLTLQFNGIVPAKGIPTTLIIDRGGKIAVRIIGPTTEPRLSAVLDPVVAEGA